MASFLIFNKCKHYVSETILNNFKSFFKVESTRKAKIPKSYILIIYRLIEILNLLDLYSIFLMNFVLSALTILLHDDELFVRDQLSYSIIVFPKK